VSNIIAEPNFSRKFSWDRSEKLTADSGQLIA